MDDKDIILVLAGLVILYLLFKGCICENKVNVVPKGDIKYITQYRFVDP